MPHSSRGSRFSYIKYAYQTYSPAHLDLASLGGFHAPFCEPVFADCVIDRPDYPDNLRVVVGFSCKCIITMNRSRKPSTSVSTSLCPSDSPKRPRRRCTGGGGTLPRSTTGILRQVCRLISFGCIGSYSGHGTSRGRWRAKSGPDLRSTKPAISKLGDILRTLCAKHVALTRICNE